MDNRCLNRHTIDTTNFETFDTTKIHKKVASTSGMCTRDAEEIRMLDSGLHGDSNATYPSILFQNWGGSLITENSAAFLLAYSSQYVKSVYCKSLCGIILAQNNKYLCLYFYSFIISIFHT